jgi:hypothetical protein
MIALFLTGRARPHRDVFTRRFVLPRADVVQGTGPAPDVLTRRSAKPEGKGLT